MSEWMKRLIQKNTVECFNCNKKTDVKTIFTVEMNTDEGLVKLNACPACAADINEALKEVEDIHNGKGI